MNNDTAIVQADRDASVRILQRLEMTKLNTVAMTLIEMGKDDGHWLVQHHYRFRTATQAARGNAGRKE